MSGVAIRQQNLGGETKKYAWVIAVEAAAKQLQIL